LAAICALGASRSLGSFFLGLFFSLLGLGFSLLTNCQFAFLRDFTLAGRSVDWACCTER
jgi:hypothetical protein